jgi:hypothetical protein
MQNFDNPKPLIMNFPSYKIALIATLAKGYFWGYRACEERFSTSILVDTELVDLSINHAINFYNKNTNALENQGIYFFALPTS